MATPTPPSVAPRPRLCHLVKSNQDEEYGFNFHSEKSRGQFIGNVDKDGLADKAGLQRGDIIAAINGVAVSKDNFKNIINRMKETPMECKLVVLTEQGAKWYAERKVPIPIEGDLVMKSKMIPLIPTNNPVPVDILRTETAPKTSPPKTFPTNPGHVDTEPTPLSSTTTKNNPARVDIEKHTTFNMYEQDDKIIDGSIGEHATIKLYDQSNMSINGSVGKGVRIYAHNQSDCTINGSIGEGTTINVFNQAECIINGTFCQGEEIHINAYNACKVEVKNVTTGNVTFSIFNASKLTFLTRPPKAIIDKIKRSNSGTITMPGGYAAHGNADKSTTSVTSTHNGVTVTINNNDTNVKNITIINAGPKKKTVINHLEGFQEHLRFKGCTVQLFKGDIVNVAKHCDVIVNTTTSNDLLGGGASCRAITNAGGSYYVEVIKKHYPHGMKGEPLVSTQAGNLACHSIYHISLPVWDNTSGAKTIVEKITKCLTEISNDALFTSIAFPVIGTGGLKYPINIVVRTMVDATIKWLKLQHNPKVKTVIFVVYPSDAVALQQFKNIFKNLKQKKKKKKENSRGEKMSEIVKISAEKYSQNVMVSDDDYTLVTLDSKSPEYKNVTDAIFRTSSPKITKIERIENPVKFDQYMALKRKLQKSVKSGLVVERNLFHGTDQKNVPGICSNGFNRSLCGKNGTKFGNGSYFARDFSYSVSYGSSSIFYANVLTGNFTKGEASFKVAPDLDSEKGTKYDSVVNDMNDPSIFVIFSDNHAYPAYLISYLQK